MRIHHPMPGRRRAGATTVEFAFVAILIIGWLIASAVAVIVASILALILGFGRIIVFERPAVSRDLDIQPHNLLCEPLAREDARLAGIAMEE